MIQWRTLAFSVQHFPHIIGHVSVIRALESDLDTENISHAYLFSGPRHIGKMTTAKAFAAALLTRHLPPTEEQRARGELDRLIHPDVLQIDRLWIEGQCEDLEYIARFTNIPQKHRKDAALKKDEISIADIRAVHERIIASAVGQYRCVIIRSAERMTIAAANAFLKILEEPPKGVSFLLTSEFPSSLLPTIISRTRLLRFSRLNAADMQPLLHGFAAEDAQFLLRFSQGAPGLVSLLRADTERFREERSTAFHAEKFWNATSRKERLELLKPLHERGPVADGLLLHLALSLREGSLERLERCASPLFLLARDLAANGHRKLALQRFSIQIS